MADDWQLVGRPVQRTASQLLCHAIFAAGKQWIIGFKAGWRRKWLKDYKIEARNTRNQAQITSFLIKILSVNTLLETVLEIRSALFITQIDEKAKSD